MATRTRDGYRQAVGFDLCPRLRDPAERRLYPPRGFNVPEGLEAVTVRRASMAAIERGWDELLRRRRRSGLAVSPRRWHYCAFRVGSPG